MPLLPWYQMLGRTLNIGTKPVWKDEARSRMGRRRESGVEIQAPESHRMRTRQRSSQCLQQWWDASCGMQPRNAA